MRPIICVENLSKQYTIGARKVPYQTLRESLTEAARIPFRWLRGDRPKEDNTIWALKDVSFEVHPGEVVGVIGPNGAGKSTLLKILSRITEPTTGRVDLYGRVGSLLEVGTGFHAELTGRENIYLNGAILGMKRVEIQRKFDDIVAFAEVSQFIDTPVKHYSSGMYLRLAFAVAAHLEPEVLLVDEVLAVGDMSFQKKCMGKMNDVARHGRTVLFVSHNLAAVRALCPSTLNLNRGRVSRFGDTSEVLAEYMNAGNQSASLTWQRRDDLPRPPARVLSVRVDSESPVVGVHQPFRIIVDYVLEREADYIIAGIHVCREGLIVFSSVDWNVRRLEPGRYSASCEIPAYFMVEGHFSVSTWIFKCERPGYNQGPMDLIDHTVSFDVENSAWLEKNDHRWLRAWNGLVRPDLNWSTTKVGSA